MAEEDSQEKDTKWTKLLKKLNADDEETDHENHDDDNATKNEDDMVSQNISKSGDGLSMTDKMSGSLAISLAYMDRNGVAKGILHIKLGYFFENYYT